MEEDLTACSGVRVLRKLYRGVCHESLKKRKEVAIVGKVDRGF